MIQFLVPWAAAGAVLLAGPLLVHMLLRRSAPRVVFPATRFLLQTRAAAVRFRRPSDIALLIVRLAIVAAGIAAAAQPLFITPSRIAQWDARTIRAVVVDTSASVRGSDVTRLAEQELSAFRAQRFESADLRDGLARAAAWLEAAPPGRREVVILSDFQRGVMDRGDLAVLPSNAGVRTIRVANPPSGTDVRLPPVAGFRGAAWQPSFRLDGTGTEVTWTKSAEMPGLAWLATAQATGESEFAARAVYAAASAGVAAGDDTRRVLVRFAGAPGGPAEKSSPRTSWIADAALALRRSELLRQTNATVAATEQNGRLVVETTAAAASVDAPALVRAVVLAVRPASIADREAEVVTIPDAALAQWRRDAAPVSGTRGPQSDSDARWFWALALVLLGVETWLRGRGRESISEQVRDAA